MGVSDHDRAYMRRIGEYKAAAHADAHARHMALTLAERLQRSWALSVAHRSELARRERDHATHLYDRARSLGLYRP